MEQAALGADLVRFGLLHLEAVEDREVDRGRGGRERIVLAAFAEQRVGRGRGGGVARVEAGFAGRFEHQPRLPVEQFVGPRQPGGGAARGEGQRDGRLEPVVARAEVEDQLREQRD